MTTGFPQDGRDGIRSVTAPAPGRVLPAQKSSQSADTPLSASSRSVEAWKWPTGTSNEANPPLAALRDRQLGPAGGGAIRAQRLPFAAGMLAGRPRVLTDGRNPPSAVIWR